MGQILETLKAFAWGSDAHALKQRAAALAVKRRFGAAARVYRRLAEVEPDESRHLLHLGDCLRNAGRRDDAKDAYYRAAAGYLKRGQHQKASAVCRVILRLDAGEIDAADMLAKTQRELELRRRGLVRDAFAERLTPTRPFAVSLPVPAPAPAPCAPPAEDLMPEDVLEQVYGVTAEGFRVDAPSAPAAGAGAGGWETLELATEEKTRPHASSRALPGRA